MLGTSTSNRSFDRYLGRARTMRGILATLVAMALPWLLSTSLFAQFSHTQLKSFGYADKLGAEPFARITLASDGRLYGTTLSSGSLSEGLVFSVARDGSDYRILRSFTGKDGDGATPYAELLEASDGALYGTTHNGGITNQGTIFRISKDGSNYAVLRQFNWPTDGAKPTGGLIEGRDGALYGTTHFGGRTNVGTIFKLGKDGRDFAVLHHFTTAGGGGVQPVSGVMEGSDGVLYGTTYFGGTANNGTIYRINKDGTGFRVLRSFVPAAGDGSNPYAGVIEGADRVLYGTTHQGGNAKIGTLFRLNRDGTGYRVVWHFTGVGTEGAQPYGKLLEGADGALYGTTAYGGPADQGTIFKLGKDGRNYQLLRSFLARGDAAIPQSGLVEGSDGVLYGTSHYGGARDQGTVFKLKKDGSDYGVVHAFSGGGDASHCYGTLAQGHDGFLIGTSWDGGAANRGTVFKIDLKGAAYRVIHNFDASAQDGANPFSGVMIGNDGVCYGTTIAGGSSGRGTVFRLNQDGADYRVLHHFTGTTSDGTQPYAGLLELEDGFLYGTTAYGGSQNLGTIFKINKDGSGFTVIRSFTGGNADGQNPYASLVRGSDGLLYGATAYGGAKNFGTIYRLNRDGSGYVILRSFLGEADGSYPFATLIEGSDRALYGTTVFGGAPNLGTVFRLSRDGTSYAMLRAFTGQAGDASKPGSGANLVEGPDGALYGATFFGGVHDAGAVFKMNKDGTGYEVIYSFDSGKGDGASPFSGLVKGGDGAFYGSTQVGGHLGVGTVFRIAPVATLALMPNGDLSITGPPGYRYAIEYLDRFGPAISWLTYLNVTLPASPAKLLLPGLSPAPLRFYRARLEP